MLNATIVGEDQTATLPLLWLDAHGDALYAFAIRRVRRSEVAEDLVQETLLAALQAWGRFEQRSNVRTWLTGILRNKVADHLRARYRHEKLGNEKLDAVPLDDDAMFTRRGRWRTPVTRWSADPVQLAQQAEFQQVMEACLSKLPVRMAHLFVSRVDGGTTTAELCAELEISSDNAWKILHRARLRLRQCLTTNWFARSSEPQTAGA